MTLNSTFNAENQTQNLISDDLLRIVWPSEC